MWSGSGTGAGLRYIANGYFLGYVKSVDMHMNDGRRYAIKDNRSQSVIRWCVSRGGNSWKGQFSRDGMRRTGVRHGDVKQLQARYT
jgi:hypothetical protein